MAGNRIIIGYGKSSVTVDGPLAGGIITAVEDAIGHEVLDEVERIAVGYRDEAESTWPVRTGKSREALDTTVRLRSRDEIDGLVSTVDYGRFIVSGKVGKEFKVRPRSPLTRLRQAVMAGRKADAERIKVALVAGLNRRIGG